VFFSEVNISGSGLGNALSEMLDSPDIAPGDQASYELCKTLWLYHPLGKKMVEGPIKMAQSQDRTISVPDSPEEIVRDAFVEQWRKDRCDDVVYNVVSVSRAYGIGSLAIVAEGIDPNVPIDQKKLADLSIAFSVFDPLNTAGSLVLNQDPNSIDFMKASGIAVNGRPYHRSRTVTIMHDRPVYIAYTTSAFGFVGRSVFQRALFPLKSFLQTMITDDLVVKKAGVFIAMLKTAGAIIDKLMQASAAMKRIFVKQATNGNVISIGVDEKIETLNMQNIDGAYGNSRKNILENIATAADMPAIILKQETFAEGFGEGTEDAKLVASYIDAFRRDIAPVYMFLDPIIQRRAWNPDFFKTVQAKYPDKYGSMRYEDAFYQWVNSYKAEWPNLLKEPDSEKVKTDDVKLKAAIAWVEVLAPELDPDNKATLIGWAADTINENKMMFQNPLILDIEALAAYEPPAPVAEPNMPKPFAATDSAAKKARRAKAVAAYAESVGDLVAMMEGRERPALPKPNGHLNGRAQA
jgi:hypothetical protein